MKIQVSKTKTVEWRAPWEKATAAVTDVVGIELESGDSRGCPAVRLQRHKSDVSVTAVGFVPPPERSLPQKWEDLKTRSSWGVPAAFRAAHAALTVNSSDMFIRQTSGATTGDDQLKVKVPEGVPMPKDGIRSVYRKMADASFVLQTGLPEYQALWLARLFPEGHKPSTVSIQTTPASLLAALAQQPGFCENGDEACVYVTHSKVYFAGFRKGLPLLFRECPGAAGAAAMREALKSRLGIDESMLDTVFANDGIIDTRPALEPLIKPVLGQIELSIDYLKNRLNAEVFRLFAMGDAAGCAALRKIAGDNYVVPVLTPGVFDGLTLPSKNVTWKGEFCTTDVSQVFLAATGAALAALEGEQ